MLGPSCSPSMARMPGPTSSHSSRQRLPDSRAATTRERSCERARSSLPRGGRTASPVAILLVPNRRVELDTHCPSQLAAERVLALVVTEGDEDRAAEGLALADDEAVARRDATAVQVAQHLRVGIRDAHEDAAVAGLEA